MRHYSQVKATRSPVIGVQVVTNKNGTYLNIFRNNIQYSSTGPFAEPMTVADALTTVAVMVRMDENFALD